MVALSFLFASNLFAQITDPVGGGSGGDSLDFDDLDEGINIDSFYRLWPSVRVPEDEPVLNPEKQAIVIYDTYAVVFSRRLAIDQSEILNLDDLAIVPGIYFAYLEGITEPVKIIKYL